MPSAPGWAGSLHRVSTGGCAVCGLRTPRGPLGGSDALAVEGPLLCRWAWFAWGGLLCCGSRGDGPPGLTGIGCRDALAWRFLGPGPWCGVCLRGPEGSACKFELEAKPRGVSPPW